MISTKFVLIVLAVKAKLGIPDKILNFTLYFFCKNAHAVEEIIVFVTSTFIIPPALKEKGVYCFTLVCLSVPPSVPNKKFCHIFFSNYS